MTEEMKELLTAPSFIHSVILFALSIYLDKVFGFQLLFYLWIVLIMRLRTRVAAPIAGLVTGLKIMVGGIVIHFLS